jgi:DNA-binding NtrC family response regulator
MREGRAPTSVGRRGTLLVVEDDATTRKGLCRLLGELGYEVVEAGDAQTAMQQALATSPDLVIIDLNLPDRNGMELIADLQARAIDATLVVLTGHASIESAVEATRKGVYDYLVKPVDRQRVASVIQKAVERATLRREVQDLRREVVRSGRLQELVGNSAAMREIYRLIEQFAASDAPVLITGESGTGKEVVVRTIHRLSPRASGRLVAVNCSAIPENLLESEMFGHEKGAFTGATTARAGCFELADHGTLFLDEIGQMAVGLQSKLLRVLEDGIVRPVGGNFERRVDVRMLAATNAALEELLGSGRFREDLYYRLNVLSLHLPPLRERPEDIPLLAERFLAAFVEKEKKPVTGFARETLDVLLQHSWPGNGRELRNAVERAVILCTAGEIQPHHLPATLRGGSSLLAEVDSQNGIIRLPVGTPIDEAEKALILRTLEACQGNKTRTASILGISVKTLYTKLHRFGRP